MLSVIECSNGAASETVGVTSWFFAFKGMAIMGSDGLHLFMIPKSLARILCELTPHCVCFKVAPWKHCRAVHISSRRYGSCIWRLVDAYTGLRHSRRSEGPTERLIFDSFEL